MMQKHKSKSHTRRRARQPQEIQILFKRSDAGSLFLNENRDGKVANA